MSAKLSGPVKGALALVIVVTGVGLWLWFSSGTPEDSPADSEAASGRSAVRSVAAEKGSAAAATSGGRATKAKAKRPRVNTDFLAGLSSIDRRICEELQEALEAEDFERTLRCAEAASRSMVAGVREQAVDALGWFGEKALPELTPLMGDADEDVAQAAMSAWQLALAEVNDPAERALTAQLALKTISDPDALEMIGGEFANAATEMIDGAKSEKQAAESRTAVIQSIVDMMGDESSATRASAAKEIYETVTGNAWVSIAEAERYLADPDNYEPPEED